MGTQYLLHIYNDTESGITSQTQKSIT